jgi:scyllo-inositol 2-dehydrogenase (NADP+)
MIRVGVVGFGTSGKVFHAPIVHAVQGLELAAIVERSSRNAEAAYPGITTYPSLEAMLGDPTIELIVIGTPNQTHLPLALQALEAGRHVVVDKPTCVTSTEIATLTARARELGKLLIPYHNRRFDSDFRLLQKLLPQEKLGRLVSFESTFDRWRPIPKPGIWRETGPGSGILLDLGTHLADQALVLFGLPLAISADIGMERDETATIDSFTIRLLYPGKTVTVAANNLAALPRPRYRLRGTQGNYVKWGLDSQEARLKADARIVEPGWGIEPAANWGSLAVDIDGDMVTRPVEPPPGDYRLFYSGVRDALLGISAPPVEPLAAWRVARLLEWAIESSAQRREISCNWEEELANSQL